MEEKPKEYYDVKNASANCLMACLWEPECREATSETEEHFVRVWKEDLDGSVTLKIWRKKI